MLQPSLFGLGLWIGNWACCIDDNDNDSAGSWPGYMFEKFVSSLVVNIHELLGDLLPTLRKHDY